MTTDRELLERAARAAGIEFDCTIRPDGKPFYHSERKDFAMADGGWFSPLTDDGDAFRLAVKLGIGLHFGNDKVTAESGMAYDWKRYEGDPASAARRAIVTCAALHGAEAAAAIGDGTISAKPPEAPPA